MYTIREKFLGDEYYLNENNQIIGDIENSIKFNDLIEIHIYMYENQLDHDWQVVQVREDEQGMYPVFDPRKWGNKL